MMSKKIGMLLLLFLVFQHCVAEEDIADSRSQAAENLLETLQAEQAMLSGLAAMADAMIQQNPMLGPYRDVILEWGASFMTWETFGPRLVELYAESFSESELRAINSFYQTSAGQSALKLMPEMMSQGAMMGAQEAEKHSALLETMIRTRAAELTELTESDNGQ